MNKICLSGMKKDIKTVHFIGVGGISMSGLAEVLLKNGFNVAGSDAVESDITKHLSGLGIKISVPNAAENINDDVDLVVFTAAVKPTNPEFMFAMKKNILMMERAELLGHILKGYEHSICVAGTHGKTTTTSFMAEIALKAGLDPTISIGGHMGIDGSNYRVGNSPCFVLEACEYSNSFHHWHPHVGIILNIDADHLDFFGSFDGVVDSFKKFAQNVKPGGVLVIQAGQEWLETVTGGLKTEVVTFGLKEGRFTPQNIEYDTFGLPSFDVLDSGKKVARINLPMPGQYNMLNALACFAAADFLGVKPEVIASALSQVKGVKRRFERKGVYNGAEIIDDYAHHPTEIEACLKAAQKFNKEVICLFQPHTYTRTRNHLNEFATSLSLADSILLLPIFAAREPFDPTISSEDIAKLLIRDKNNTTCFNNFETALSHLRKTLTPNHMLITMGAGDVYKIGESLLST